MTLIAARTGATAHFALRLTLFRGVARLSSSTAPFLADAPSTSSPASPDSSAVNNASTGTSPASVGPSRPQQPSLTPNIPLTALQLPVQPLPSPIPPLTPVPLDRPTLERLHRLSALNPPPSGSEEERALSHELGELLGLMDLVKELQMPEGLEVGELLSQGVGEVVIDETSRWPGDGEAGAEGGRSEETAGGETEARGRELLNWSTNRVGDYYAHRRPPTSTGASER